MKISLFSALFLAGHLCMAAPMPLPESNDGAKHVFATNQENFLMDGKPVKIISGECTTRACRVSTGRTGSSA